MQRQLKVRETTKLLDWRELWPNTQSVCHTASQLVINSLMVEARAVYSSAVETTPSPSSPNF